MRLEVSFILNLKEPTPDNDAKFTDLPVTDILSKVDSSQFYELMASQKWTDRKEQLEWLIPLLDVPRLKNGSYTQLGGALQKVFCSIEKLSMLIK